MTNIQQTFRNRNVNNYVIINDGRDLTVNFEPSEYMRKMIFQSVMQETQMKRSDFPQQELNL